MFFNQSHFLDFDPIFDPIFKITLKKASYILQNLILLSNVGKFICWYELFFLKQLAPSRRLKTTSSPQYIQEPNLPSGKVDFVNDIEEEPEEELPPTLPPQPQIIRRRRNNIFSDML